MLSMKDGMVIATGIAMKFVYKICGHAQNDGIPPPKHDRRIFSPLNHSHIQIIRFLSPFHDKREPCPGILTHQVIDDAVAGQAVGHVHPQ